MADLGRAVGIAVVDVQRGAGPVVIRLEGEFDLSNVELILRAIDSLDPAEVETVTVDMTDVLFLDSSGLSTLVTAANKFGGYVRIRNANALVRRVFETSGLLPILRFES